MRTVVTVRSAESTVRILPWIKTKSLPPGQELAARVPGVKRIAIKPHIATGTLRARLERGDPVLLRRMLSSTPVFKSILRDSLYDERRIGDQLEHRPT